MRKLFFLTVALSFVSTIAWSGGIVTNTNQSASFIRMPARDASLGIDATYYNPAGLVFLNDGIHFSLSNQYISQERNIKSSFPGMNRDEFTGTVTAPLFPTFYAVYKKDKLAFSLGVNPIGGGGSAFFKDGLPSFEQMVAVLPVSLTSSGITTTSYSFDTEFDGSSLIWGFQANASYKLTDQLSASLGVRMLSAKNTYAGYLTDVKINPNQPGFGANYNGTNMVSAPVFFNDAATTLQAMSAGATAAAAGLQGAIDDGLGAVPLAALPAEQSGPIQALIVAAGLDPTGINIETAQGMLNLAAPGFAANGTAMAGFALLTSDKKVDAMQTGSGFAPVIGLNYSFNENLNIAVRYEHMAKITLVNETTKDDVGLYPDKAETRSDMPANLSIGIGYKPMSKLKVSAGYHLYFDKSANYGKKINNAFVENSEVIDNNFWEAALGFEYELSSKLLLSAGYLRTQTGVNTLFHSDLSHSLNTNSIGLGGRYMINENMGINLGYMNTMYQGYVKSFTAGYTEEYNRKASVIAIGFDFSF
jgi:long-chain fatty acid transport protein